jgi:hypothetical protein
MVDMGEILNIIIERKHISKKILAERMKYSYSGLTKRLRISYQNSDFIERVGKALGIENIYSEIGKIIAESKKTLQ